MPLTTRGLELMFKWAFRSESRPANFYMALVTSATAPTAATKTLSQLTEITQGNGYTSGGYSLSPNATDFTAIAVDDTLSIVSVALKTIAWSASGGDIPPSGNPARHVVMTTDESPVGNRQIIWYQSLLADRLVNSGGSLTLAEINARIRGGSMVRIVQRGSVTLANGVATNTATIFGVDLAKALCTHLGQQGEGGASDNEARLTLTNSTTVTATRSTVNRSGQVIVNFEVVEYW